MQGHHAANELLTSKSEIARRLRLHRFAAANGDAFITKKNAVGDAWRAAERDSGERTSPIVAELPATA